MQTVHASLLDIFRRTRALRSRLIALHPELAATAAAADAAREAEIEQVRNGSTASDDAALASADVVDYLDHLDKSDCEPNSQTDANAVDEGTDRVAPLEENQ